MAVHQKVKRSQMAVFLNTVPDGTADYELLGYNIPELSISYNPQTLTQQDITQDTASTDVIGYQPNSAVTQSCSKTDPVYLFINKLRRSRAVLADAASDIIIVDLYENDQTSSKPIAEKQPITIQFDSYGGTAEEPLTIGYTINFSGDATIGSFDTSTKTFTPK